MEAQNMKLSKKSLITIFKIQQIINLYPVKNKGYLNHYLGNWHYGSSLWVMSVYNFRDLIHGKVYAIFSIKINIDLSTI